MAPKESVTRIESAPRRGGSHTRPCWYAALALLLPAILADCRACPSTPRGPRLVLLFATCSVSRQHLAPYAPSVEYTPHLARFAAQGKVFERYQVEEGMSGPAFASLLTGTQADRHGVFTHPSRLADDRLLLTEAFADAGFETWYWDDHPIAAADLGYAQGVPPAHIVKGLPRSRSPALHDLLAGLRDDPSRKALVVTAFTVTHGPYGIDRVAGFCRRHPRVCGDQKVDEILRQGEIYHANRLLLERSFEETSQRLGLVGAGRQAFARALEVIYSSRIEYLDRLFGHLVAAIDRAGLADEALIVFAADHGEILFRENAPFKWTHGYMLEPEDLTAPLIVRGPGIDPGRYEGVARSIDVFPTLAALEGVTIPPETVQGTDLSRALRGLAPEPNLPALSHTLLVPHEVYARSAGWTTLRHYFREMDAPGMWVAVRERDLFCRRRSVRGCDLPPELYDLATDPGLETNLYDARRADHRRLSEAVAGYKHTLVAAYQRGPAASGDAGTTEALRRLEALGYLEGSAPVTSETPEGGCPPAP